MNSRVGMRALCLSSALALAGASMSAGAQDAPAPPQRKAFRVCQDPNLLPYTNLRGDGFLNKIAEIFAKDLGLPVEYYSFPQRQAFIRNTLRYKLPGEDYRCDIVMDVPSGFDQVSVTKPYYRSTYAMVFAPGKGLDGVASIEDFLKLDRSVLNKLRIGLYDRTPASEWLSRYQLVDQAVPYQTMSPDPEQYPGEIIERDLVNGKIDAAIVWGPIAGFFAKRVTEKKLTVLPMKSEKNIKFDFQIAMGVRYGEREWKQQIESLIDKRRPEIQAILQEYGVPLLQDDAAGSARP